MLAAGAFAPAYLILGQATPLVDQAAAAVLAAVRPRMGPVAFNHARVRAGDPDAIRAFSGARTLPMMADLRLVELRDVHEAPADVWEALVNYLKEPCSSAVLLVVGSGFPKVEKGGSNWGARVKSALGDSVLMQLDASDAAAFAADVARSLDKRLDRSDAELLIELVGQDLGRVDQEVRKLALFVGEADRIDADAIVAATGATAEAVIWDLTAGLAARDPEVALGALHRLTSAGEDARKLLGMIAWQMRELLKVRELVLKGADDRQIASAVRIRWDLLRRVRPEMERGTFPDPAELLRRLATANRHMNSHRAGADRILEGLVLEMLSGRLRRPPPVPRPR
ncbi:MAG: DNA polymerase III subunit delta [Alphaproteobacteria bacterium]|nr:DNA polymerase III subunit delta [Alphaproteobacteria bacterium]